jgi:hypothetical protein
MNDDNRLVPKRPPGRSTRKARAFHDQIQQLHAQGYTLEAIREALAEAGVQVSNSTVQREAARHALPRPVVAATPGKVQAVDPAATARGAATGKAPPVPAADTTCRASSQSGKDIAEAFVRGRVTNVLLRIRSHDESSRH